MNDTTLNNLREEILSVIPSESLKRRLKEPDYRPSDQDLLVIAYNYAPDCTKVKTEASPSRTSGRAPLGSTPSAPSPSGIPQSGIRCLPPVSQPNGAERSRVQIRMQGSGLPVPLCRSTVGADIMSSPRTAAPISRNNVRRIRTQPRIRLIFYPFFALRADCIHPISGTA